MRIRSLGAIIFTVLTLSCGNDGSNPTDSGSDDESSKTAKYNIETYYPTGSDISDYYVNVSEFEDGRTYTEYSRDSFRTIDGQLYLRYIVFEDDGCFDEEDSDRVTIDGNTVILPFGSYLPVNFDLAVNEMWQTENEYRKFQCSIETDSGVVACGSRLFTDCLIYKAIATYSYEYSYDDNDYNDETYTYAIHYECVFAPGKGLIKYTATDYVNNVYDGKYSHILSDTPPQPDEIAEYLYEYGEPDSIYSYSRTSKWLAPDSLVYCEYYYFKKNIVYKFHVFGETSCYYRYDNID